MRSEPRVLHPDWPPFKSGSHAWDQGAPTVDLIYAMEHARVYLIGPEGSSVIESTVGTRKAAVDRVARIDQYYVSYHGVQWAPGGEDGSELTMVVLGQLVDGRWFALTAWNDYTGWDCQDGADVRIAVEREEAIRYGFSDEDRALVGLTL